MGYTGDFLHIACILYCVFFSGDFCFIHFLGLYIERLFHLWRRRKKEFQQTQQERLLLLSRPIFSWLGANYKLMCKKGEALPWLALPRNQQMHGNNDINDSKRNDPTLNVNSDEITGEAECIKECSNCRKDLVHILILLLCECVDHCTKDQIEGKTPCT